MEKADEVFGCFVSCPATVYNSNKTEEERLVEQELLSEICRKFRGYIWGEKGICNTLKKLKYEDYGMDLKLALFQFYVNPLPIEIQNLKEIESYRKKEKAIGVPIIVNDENFFSKSEEGRYGFLKQSILQKLDLLAEVGKKKKLDTNVELLKADISKVLYNT